MEQLKKELKKLFRLEPYTGYRYQQAHKVNELTKQLNIHLHYSIDSKRKIAKVEFLKKDKGLYETIDNIIIENIKLEVR